jgi:acetate kinase
MTAPVPILLTFNPGSSTIKLGVFAIDADGPRRMGKGVIDLRSPALVLRIMDGTGSAEVPLLAALTEELQDVIEETLEWLMQHFSGEGIVGVGHRVVHGGDQFAGPEIVTEAILREIKSLIPLAPLHQPQSVRLMEAIRHLRSDLPQSASFDTAFHRTQSDLVRRFALPRGLFDEGVKRYGFHGLSYKYVAAELLRVAPDKAEGRVVVAHLGSGASLCGLKAGISCDTTMSFSTLDGIPMGTRCGALDPGVLIHLIKERGMSIEAVQDMLYHRSGLLGVSGISADSRTLMDSSAPSAAEALDLFAFRISREMVAMANTLGGLDAIVFTAGIGEHQHKVRAAVCHHLAWLGVRLDTAANARHATRMEAPDSEVAVLVIPTDEAQIIAMEAYSILQGEFAGPHPH